jgi:hypothetical protein
MLCGIYRGRSEYKNSLIMDEVVEVTLNCYIPRSTFRDCDGLIVVSRDSWRQPVEICRTEHRCKMGDNPALYPGVCKYRSPLGDKLFSLGVFLIFLSSSKQNHGEYL